MPNLRPVLPVGFVVAEAVRAGTADWPVPPILVTDLADKHDAFAAAEAGLIKSGTSSLEMAVAGVPHLVAYKVNPITAAILRRLVRVPYVSLVNLLSERLVVPELLQQDATPAALAATLHGLLTQPEMVSAQRDGFADLLGKLRPSQGMPSAAAAAAVLACLMADRAR